MTYNWISKIVRNNFCAVGALLLPLFLTSSLQAQQSDNAIAPNACYNMMNVAVGATSDHQVVAKNETSANITISSVGLVCGTTNFQFSLRVTLPIILKVGEQMVLGVVSYSPFKANENYVGYLMINHSPKLHSEDGEVRIHGTSIVDSSLLIPCLTGTFDSAVFGPVIYQGSVVRTLSVKNNRDEAKVLRCIDFTVGDREAFASVGNVFPMTIPPHEMREIKIAFNPNIGRGDSSNIFISRVLLESMDPNDGCNPDFQMNGVGVANISGNETMLLDDTTRILAMSDPGLKSVHSFTWKNNGNTAITITKASVTHGTEGIGVVTFGGKELPFTIEPGESFSVQMGYAAQDMVVHYDKLVLSTNNNKTFSYDLQALRTPSSSVHTTNDNTEASLSISPNPSSGAVKITMASDFIGEIAIYTIDGKLIASQKNTNSWLWGATSGNNGRISNQEYIVRATGQNSHGQKLTRAEKLILLAH